MREFEQCESRMRNLRFRQPSLKRENDVPPKQNGIVWTRRKSTDKMQFRTLFVLGILLVFFVLVTIGVVFLALHLKEDPNSLDCLSSDEKFTCYFTNRNYYRFYGTKTAYHVARDALKKQETSYVPKGCVPRFFYMISRHATRYPDEKYIVEFTERLPVLKQMIIDAFKAKKGKLCESDVAGLDSWRLGMVPDDDNRISSTGIEETRKIAERYKERFPALFGDDFSPERYVLGFTSRNRTLSTLEAFVSGLFGEEVTSKVNYSQPEDDLLQFHKACKAIKKKSGIKTKEDPEEVVKFENSSLFSSILARISKKVGFSVNKDDLEIIYRICVFEFSIYRRSPWCSLLEEDDMRIIEFAEDLDDYYNDGYGHDVNYKQACPVVEDLLAYIDEYLVSNKTKVVLRFSHAGAVKKILSRFGLFRDARPLIADRFCEQVDRKWKSSLLCPFASNFVVVLYSCNDEHKLGAFVQEEPVILDGCSSHLCDVDKFVKHYEALGMDCNLNSICSS